MTTNSNAPSASGCPVDHGSQSKPTPSQMGECPVDHSARKPELTAVEQCPVDHGSRAAWTQQGSHSSLPPNDQPAPAHLSNEREVSSIPRVDGDNWVYPSQAQFYSAMARKNHSPRGSDMGVIVPIHNAVNERAWGEVMKWEGGRGGDKCGGVKLVSFKGDAAKISIKARVKMLFGYAAPFDRHDWLVDRCGLRMRYIIDFYTGRPNSSTPSPAGNLSFYLDVRPALDNWEGAKMRMEMFWNRWILGSNKPNFTPPPMHPSHPQKS